MSHYTKGCCKGGSWHCAKCSSKWCDRCQRGQYVDGQSYCDRCYGWALEKIVKEKKAEADRLMEKIKTSSIERTIHNTKIDLLTKIRDHMREEGATLESALSYIDKLIEEEGMYDSDSDADMESYSESDFYPY